VTATGTAQELEDFTGVSALNLSTVFGDLEHTELSELETSFSDNEDVPARCPAVSFRFIRFLDGSEGEFSAILGFGFFRTFTLAGFDESDDFGATLRFFLIV
jgi:hypothetical protein